MRRPGSSIRNRIVRTTVAIGLVPLAVLGAAVLVGLQRLSSDAGRRVDESRAALSNQVVTAGLEGTAHNVADDVDAYVLERVHDVQVWASDPLVRSAAETGGREAKRLGLDDRSIEELENRYRDGPSLGTSPETAGYLAAQVKASGAFAEMFLTEADGLNVAYSSKTSDFVQRDEDWWKNAWANGLDVGAIAYDESAQVFSSEISVRVDNGAGTGVGVLKAVLNLNVVQRIADQQARGRAVTVLNEGGLILAETATHHDQRRIMNPELTWASTVVPEIARTVDAARGKGDSSVITGDRAVGAAMTGRTQQPVEGFAGFAWTVVVDQPTQIAFAPLASIGEVRQSVDNLSTVLTVLVVLVVLLVGVIAFAVAVPLAQRIVRPILRLRDEADDIATTRLPALVESIDRLGVGEELPALEPLAVPTGDEVEELADKFNSVMATAGRLAAEQVESRRQNLSTTFVSMGRRNQRLLGRQLRVLDDLERNESDPDALEGLFRLDQLATRMRRNAESLLVLAGQEPTRTWSRTVSMHDVVRSAVSEIEEYARVDFSSIEPAWVRGNVVAEVAHLLAELCENATAFSPPDTTVEVIGRARAGGYRLSIVDRGIGMSEEAIAEANEKLQRPDGFDRVPSQYLGHFVVGRLAARLGVEVRLFESAADGLVARVTLPSSLLEAQPPDAAPTPAGAAGATAPAATAATPLRGVPGMAGPAAPDANGATPAGRSRPPGSPAEEPAHLTSPAGLAIRPRPLRRQPPPGAGGGPDDVEVTASGFRVRQRRGPAIAPASSVTPVLVPAPSPAPDRSADAARSTLSTFMSGVRQGRRAVSDAVDRDEPDAPEDQT